MNFASFGAIAEERVGLQTRAAVCIYSRGWEKCSFGWWRPSRAYGGSTASCGSWKLELIEIFDIRPPRRHPEATRFSYYW